MGERTKYLGPQRYVRLALSNLYDTLMSDQILGGVGQFSMKLTHYRSGAPECSPRSQNEYRDPVVNGSALQKRSQRDAMGCKGTPFPTATFTPTTGILGIDDLYR
jgi:hypothetical protein